ncbi:DUF5819 family protein [Streptomyces sp. NPDC048751]|uniref:DUF5819 family protein n=1 Tax=Streptomyces sp. NPDC048751 TaxID=3365591 RepID=UPI0037111BC2
MDAYGGTDAQEDSGAAHEPQPRHGSAPGVPPQARATHDGPAGLDHAHSGGRHDDSGGRDDDHSGGPDDDHPAGPDDDHPADSPVQGALPALDAHQRSVPPPEPRTGVAALSPRYQIGAALALAVVAVTVCVHIGMVFLHVAPSNTVTKRHGRAIDDWVYPEFEQNWKLFAPNPLQQNIAVQVRAQVSSPNGDLRTTGWYDLSAEDGRAIEGNLLPSHTQQNELRRAWDYFVATHGADNRPVGLRGSLSETYLRRIVVLRLSREGVAGADGVLERVQVRSSTTNVRPPEWSREQISLKPTYRVMSWWSVPADEAMGGVK